MLRDRALSNRFAADTPEYLITVRSRLLSVTAVPYKRRTSFGHAATEVWQAL
jgi:hypothetical protein